MCQRAPLCSHVRRRSLRAGRLSCAAVRARAALGFAVVAVVLTGITLAITPRSEVNGGLGFDGRFYARITDDLRGGDVPVPSLAAYRVLPSALVALSGLDVRDGFLALSLVASIATLVLLGAILAARGVPSSHVLVALVCVATLPAGLRYFVYQPVLVDASGLALLLALVYAAAQRRAGIFAALMPFGVLARENLFALVPFLWLRIRARPRALIVAALAGLPGLAAMILVRVAPPIPVDQFVPVPLLALKHLAFFALNIDDGEFTDHALRYVAAVPLGLGVLAVLPAVWWRDSVAILRREPHWAYLIASTLALAVVGGYDYDRYLLPLCVPLAVLAFEGARTRGTAPAAWTGIALLHLIAVRYGWPIGTDRSGALGYFVATMPPEHLLGAAAVAVPCLAAAGVIALRLPRGDGAIRAPRTA